MDIERDCEEEHEEILKVVEASGKEPIKIDELPLGRDVQVVHDHTGWYVTFRSPSSARRTSLIFEDWLLLRYVVRLNVGNPPHRHTVVRKYDERALIKQTRERKPKGGAVGRPNKI